MKGFLKEMTREEIKEFDGKKVVCIYCDFDEKLNGEKTELPTKPFRILATYGGKWYTNGELYIHIYQRFTNTFLDFLARKGVSEEEARRLATNDLVTITGIYKKV